MSRIDNYVNEVIRHIDADRKMKTRIKADLTLQLNDAAEAGNMDEVLEKMGEPEEVAKEFMDTIYDSKGGSSSQFKQTNTYGGIYMNRIYEYKSKANLFGVPVVHIKFSRFGKPAVAKGIIAIGTVSVGVISIGALPVGVVCLGGAALGLFSFGGLAIGLLLAAGGLAVGGMAIGGVAVGLGALGGLAVGKIAFGGYAVGTVAVGAQAVGEHALTVQNTGPETREAVQNLIKTAYPNLPDWIGNFFSSIRASFHNN